MNSPFDEQKYKSLSEGLEISEILLSEILSDKVFRMDSEPFQKSNKVSLHKPTYVKISEIADINPIKSELSHLDKNTSVSFIPMKLLGKGIIDNQERGKIADYIKGYTYFAENDIIIAQITPCMEHGKCAIAKGLINRIGFGSTEYNIFRVKNENILTEYLFAFLNREVIRKEAAKNMVGTSGRQRVPIAFYNNLVIPVLSNQIQEKIKNNIQKSYTKRELSQTLCRQAEELLLETIGLKDFKPSQEGINIKSLKESFLATGRLDAEYYQPKYEDYIQLIKNYPNGFEYLIKICNLKDNNFVPQDNHEYKYIELADIGKLGNITGCTIAKGSELPTRARRKVNVKDVIISSIEGSLESCALVTEDYDNALCSTGFYAINSSKINSETILVLFKSDLLQNILKQNCSGTILTAINKTEFQNIPVPIIDFNIQQQIAALIQESFALREESERLLEEAKEMVEQEISG